MNKLLQTAPPCMPHLVSFVAPLLVLPIVALLVLLLPQQQGSKSTPKNQQLCASPCEFCGAAAVAHLRAAVGAAAALLLVAA
jgi:hypothetical protein